MITNWEDIKREVFIETGTKAGNTIWAAKDFFPCCHSVEINSGVHARAVVRFKDWPGVHIHLGDSRLILPRIIEDRPTTFYLDAHCEGWPSFVPESDTECPLLGELWAIVEARWTVKPIVMVDDINMFYPSYWTDPESNHKLFKSEDWPRMETISQILAGWTYYEDKPNRIGIWV